jgi:pyruvate,water dikinase
MKNKRAYILRFQETDQTKLSIVGGKGANLGELSRIGGLKVPEGFCITTEVFRKITERNKLLDSFLDALANLKSEDRKSIGETSAKIRALIEEIIIPEDIAHEITQHIEQLGEKNAYAVRSSATAEDLPTASFAGQQDTYLNIIGKKDILKCISKCWASLFTDRAVIYRLQNGFDHRKVSLSVVIQKMTFPRAAGIMFTADPITSNRKILSVDASFGLGEALVSGIVNADNYKVCDGKIIAKKISTKKLAVLPSNEGGTKEHVIGLDRQNLQTLTDKEIIELEQLGRKIERHFGKPQDIEWCLHESDFYIVQSRPITTSYPVPESNDQENHVYISVGHNQMMTDAMKPLGLSFFLLVTPAPMRIAGGRLFVDVTAMLATSVNTKKIIDTLGKSDPLIKDALMTIIEREDFIKPEIDVTKGPSATKSNHSIQGPTPQIENDPAIVSELVQHSQASIKELKQNIQGKSGPSLFDFILEDIPRSKQILFGAQSMAAIMAGIDASAWLNEKMNEWLGEKNAADTLSQSVQNNITSEMGLALLDVADVIRPYPEVIEYLKHVKNEQFLHELIQYTGGEEAREAIHNFLTKYGMRCPGEIDISRTRWNEKPSALVPMILSNIKSVKPHDSSRRFTQGRQEAVKKEQNLLERLAQLPDGQQKIKETKQMISRLRNFIGYREYPKYELVNRYFVYKQALLKEAEQLVRANLIPEKEDIYYLTFEELREVAHTNKLDYQIVSKRKDEYKIYEKLTPPRVITSDGEIIAGAYKRGNLPADAIIGLAVSSGVVEGRARVILKMEDADIEEGDI